MTCQPLLIKRPPPLQRVWLDTLPITPGTILRRTSDIHSSYPALVPAWLQTVSIRCGHACMLKEAIDV